MAATGQPPEDIVKAKGLTQVSDPGALEKVIEDLIDAHPEEVARYREGQTKLLGFFVGQVMRATQGKANPQLVNQLLKTKIDG